MYMVKVWVKYEINLKETMQTLPTSQFAVFKILHIGCYDELYFIMY